MDEMKTIDKKTDGAEKLWQKSRCTANNDKDWGFYSYGDASPAIGGGIGTFVWFDSKNEMIEFISNTLPYAPPGPSDTDTAAVAKKTSLITEQYKKDDLNSETFLEQLNKVLVSHSQLTWLGTFEELKTGSSVYALNLRSEFKENCELEENFKKNIPKSHLNNFKQFLEEYGF